jgi:extracellular elastinolytic metalloproteinase
LDSPADAFPGAAPRPLAPNLTLRTFDVPNVTATAVRLTALDNQCTGGPEYQGERDADPLNATDCDAASDQGTVLHAAELQVFGQDIGG